ncbi:MAG: hypothetical protein ACRC5A_03835 [Enterobacteriaceae bacterium]
MRWQIVLTSCLVTAGILLSWAMPYVNAALPAASEAIQENSIQLGFYDLRDGQQEIYEAAVLMDNSAINVTLTQPNNPHFQAQGRLQTIESHHSTHLLTYQTLYYRNDNNNPMISDALDYLQHNPLNIVADKIPEQSSIFNQAGLLVLWP